jgi:Rrf2 family nitric oxide-sensitive transcriptional repressor
MQLTLYTDYSLRVLLYLGLKNDRATIGEIATSFRISRTHLVKVVHALGKRGYIRTTRGPKGGIALARDPAKIRLGRFIFETEKTLDLVECFDAELNTCPIAGMCRLEDVLHAARTEFLSVLNRKTLADLIGPPDPSDRRLKRLGLSNRVLPPLSAKGRG